MNILIPGTSDQITWSIQNLQDTTTYYVRAVIRDVRTETILKTLNLTDLGNGRFSGVWNVPQDGSGFGREIEIEKTVYEDSGYTVPSGTYGRWLDRALIFNLANRLPSTGGYGGHTNQVDYKEIARIIKKEVETAMMPMIDSENKEKETPIDLSPVLQSLKMISSGLSGLATRISAMEVKDDNTHEEFDSIINDVMRIKDDIKSTIESSNSDLRAEFETKISEITSIIKEIEKKDRTDLAQVEKKMEKQIASILKRFEAIIEDGGKKLHSHVQDAMSKPLSVSLVGSALPSKKESTTADLRQEHIKRLIG